MVPESWLDPISAPPEFIVNADKVTALYGGWPRFHDAELVSLTFDRETQNLVARILAFHVDRTQTDENGHYKVVGKYLITFRFLKIKDLEMLDFNHQNVLAGIYIDGQQGTIEVTLHGIFGAHLAFKCSSVIVDQVASETL